MSFPAQNLSHGATFTLPQDLTIAVVAGVCDTTVNNVLDVAVGSANGSKLVQVRGGGVSDVSYVIPVNLKLPKGTVIFNNGDNAVLIFG